MLTDPNFLHRGQYAYLGKGLMSRRLTEPALAAYRAYRPTWTPWCSRICTATTGTGWRAGRLDRSLPIITTPHASRRLQGVHGFSRATGLPTWHDQVLVKEHSQVRVTALPGRHAPGRWRSCCHR